jgi:small conductance mechanosensitive channel
MDGQSESLGQVKTTVLDMLVRLGPKLVVAVVILTVGYMVGRRAGGVLDRMLARLQLDAPVRSLLVRMGRLVVLALFGILALQNLGVEPLPLIAGLGVAGAGVALAMQGVLANVFAGLTIIFTQPFHVGNYISIAREEGDVLRSNSRVLQEPAPRIGVTRLADSSVNISVNPWVRAPDYDPAPREISRAILDVFRARNVVIPFPQREVRLAGARA